jgi:hypothetical protein
MTVFNTSRNKDPLKERIARNNFPASSFYGFHHILQVKEGRIRIEFEAIKLHCKTIKYRVSTNDLQPFGENIKLKLSVSFAK